MNVFAPRGAQSPKISMAQRERTTPVTPTALPCPDTDLEPGALVRVLPDAEIAFAYYYGWCLAIPGEASGV